MAFVETKNHIKSQVMLTVSIERGSLIDFETTGIPFKDREHEITSFGYITSNKLVIITRRIKEKAPFYSEIKGIIKKLPRPFYAYNAKFEKDMMKEELNLSFEENDFVDLQSPWKTKAESIGLKWPKLDELISEPEKYFGDMRVSGKDCPGLWKGYLATNNENLLKMIAQHNLSDLLREAILLLLHPQLYKNK
ncbi:MAG: ribonuclease H-like domain-containing protein [Thermoproteota archaeon]|jgi:uncharacterized protein YprB with RNaseH-like and TPR domain